MRFDLEALNDLCICSNSVCAPGQVQQVINVNTGILETVMLEKASDAFLSKLQLYVFGDCGGEIGICKKMPNLLLS